MEADAPEAAMGGKTLLLQKKRFVAAQQQAHRQVMRDTNKGKDCTAVQH